MQPYLEHGYLFRRYANPDKFLGDELEVVPEFMLSSKSVLRDWAKQSTPDCLYASVTKRWYERHCFIGTLPTSEQLRAYFKRKHGNPRGLNWLFASRIETLAALEWVEEQKDKQHREIEERRARALWNRYYTMFDEHHVSAMSGSEFERFVGKLYTRLGYVVSLTQGGADQGVDLILYKDDHKIAVQAKRWNAPVGNAAVQQVIAGKLYYGCSAGIIVTNSSFSGSAVALAAKDPSISLVDGRSLTKLWE
jgi:hypothetical protein